MVNPWTSLDHEKVHIAISTKSKNLMNFQGHTIHSPNRTGAGLFIELPSRIEWKQFVVMNENAVSHLDFLSRIAKDGQLSKKRLGI